MLTPQPAWIEVDVAALVHNAGVLRRVAGEQTRLGILVKANGYGHGLEMAARAALRGGADQLIVATLDEGLALRRAGIATPVLLVYAIPAEAVAEAAEADLELSLTGVSIAERTLEKWASVGATGRRPLRVQVEVDSGMGRGGVSADHLPDVVRLINQTQAVEVTGIWSHLANGSDQEVSGAQVARFESAVDRLSAPGRQVPSRHVVATEGLFRATAPAYDMVRIGLGFYGELGVGVYPAPELAEAAAELRPAMTVKARPVRLEPMPAGATVGYGGEWTARRTSLIATLPIGYADGWTRAYWPGASALVRGRRVALVGRVSMDSVCADVTDVDGVSLDDEFVLLGGQGEERITPGQLAVLRGTIINEVFCDFGPRLPRVYVDDGEVVAVLHGPDRLDHVRA